MWEYNDGTSESNVLQNQFTAYLVTAVHRKKIQYLQAKSQYLKNEFLMDTSEYRKYFRFEPDMSSQLSFWEQLENERLYQALKRLKEREVLIFLLKVLDNRSFQEIADETGITYKTVASIYYRMIQKLRNELGGEKNEF